MVKDKCRIFVDADACPVRDEILQISDLFDVDVYFVASYPNIPNLKTGGIWVSVDSRREEADLYIVNHANAGDIVVTHDIGLASLLVGKQVHVISPRGRQYTEATMDELLHQRYLSYKGMRAGQRLKGPQAFKKEDRMRFEQVLSQILSGLEGI